MPALETVEFQNCHNELDLTPLANARDLKRLDAWFCDGIKFKGIGSLVSLQHLGIKALSDSDLETLVAFSRLTELSLCESTLITDTGMAHLSSVASLKSLELFGLPNVTDKGILHFNRLKNLRELTVIGTTTTQFSTAAVDDLKRSLPECRIQLNPNGVMP